jgi:hypothetical protein
MKTASQTQEIFQGKLRIFKQTQKESKEQMKIFQKEKSCREKKIKKNDR